MMNIHTHKCFILPNDSETLNNSPLGDGGKKHV